MTNDFQACGRVVYRTRYTSGQVIEIRALRHIDTSWTLVWEVSIRYAGHDRPFYSIPKYSFPKAFDHLTHMVTMKEWEDQARERERQRQREYVALRDLM